MKTKERFLTVGGRGQKPVPAPVLGISLAELVNDAVAYTEFQRTRDAVEHIMRTAQQERVQRSEQAKKDAHNLAILQLASGTKIVHVTQRRLLRFVQAFWHGRGRDRRLVVTARSGRQQTTLWADDVQLVPEVVAERLEGGWN